MKTPARYTTSKPAAVLVALVLLAGAALAETAIQRWATRINGTANDADIPYSTVTDALGNVICGGLVRNSTTSADFHVAKFDAATGAALWSYTKNGVRSDGSTNSFDSVRCVALAPDGFIYAAGIVIAAARPQIFEDWYLVKLNPVTGEKVWDRAWGSTGSDNIQDMTVDNEGNVLLVGYLQGGVGSYKIIKVRGDGTDVWTRSLYTLQGTTQDYNITGQRVVTDSAGDVMICGTNSYYSPRRFWATKLTGDTGARVWEWAGGRESNGLVGGMAVDGDGHAVLSAASYNASTNDDLLVVKINGSSGAEMWQNIYDHGVGGNERAAGVAVSPEGHVIAVGSSQETYDPNFGTGYYRMVTRKIHGQTGAALWTQRYAGELESLGRFVAVTPYGEVLAAGFGGAARLIKYAGADGAVIWETAYQGTSPNSGDSIQSINFKGLALGPGGSAAFGVYSDGDWAAVVFAPDGDADNDGLPDSTDPDDDNDTLPDTWELANGFNPLSAADAAQDADGDSHSNLAEYIAGTDPRNGSSALTASLATPPAPGGSVAISFQAVAGRSYTVRYKTDLGSPTWTALQHYPVQTASGPVTVVDTPQEGTTRRFYQVVTPQQP